MNWRIVGAAMVILGCGGFGFSMAAAHRREERHLRQLTDILQFAHCELQFRLTPLPELCRMVGNQGKGEVYRFFDQVGEILLQQRLPEVGDCVHEALQGNEFSPGLRELLTAMGQILGHFDLKGQLSGLENLRRRCMTISEELSKGREDRLRSYQTLGLCAGAALVILFV